AARTPAHRAHQARRGYGIRHAVHPVGLARWPSGGGRRNSGACSVPPPAVHRPRRHRLGRWSRRPRWGDGRGERGRAAARTPRALTYWVLGRPPRVGAGDGGSEDEPLLAPPERDRFAAILYLDRAED